LAGEGAGRLSLKKRFPAIFADEQKAMQAIVLLACLAVSSSIGFTYARHIQVAGWQLWTWLVTVAIAAGVSLYDAGRPPLTWRRSWRWLGVLLLLAFVLRVLLLGSLPGGLHVDEVGTADFTLRHIFPNPQDTINPFRTGLASQPALYNYIVRLMLALMGNNIFGLRISSALIGTLAILATYAMIAVYQNRRVALLAAILMTTYHYHIHWSRIGLNNIWDTFWVPAMLATFAWGWRKEWTGGAVLAGLAAGFSQYFYAGSKIGILLLVFAVLDLRRHSRSLPGEERPAYNRRLARYLALFFLVTAIVAVPIFFHAVRQPENYFDRPQIVFAFTRESINSSDLTGYIWDQLQRSFGAFTTVPDGTGFYGPGVPLLIGLAAPIFAIGFFWAIYKDVYLPVLWILLTIFFGGFLLLDPPSSSHYVVSIPAVCWLVAMPLAYLADHGRWRWAATILALIIITDLVFYFGVYIPAGPRDLVHPFPPLP